VNHCWAQNIFVATGIKHLLQAKTGFGYKLAKQSFHGRKVKKQKSGTVMLTSLK